MIDLIFDRCTVRFPIPPLAGLALVVLAGGPPVAGALCAVLLLVYSGVERT